MKPHLFPFVLVSLVVASAHAADTPAEDLKNLKGTWNVMVRNMYVVNPDSLKPFRMGRDNADTLQFDGDKVKFLTRDGKPCSELTVKLGPAKSPKTIDLVVDGKTWLGIYELKDNTLRLCVLDGPERPTDLTGEKHITARAGTLALTLKRAK